MGCNHNGIVQIRCR